MAGQTATLREAVGLFHEPERLDAAVSELQGSLWRIDPLLRRAQKIALSEPVRGACSVSMQQQPLSRFTRLQVDGRSVHLAPDQRFAYVIFAGGVR